MKLLESAARLSANDVRREPLEVAGQMHARLMGYGDVLSDFHRFWHGGFRMDQRGGGCEGGSGRRGMSADAGG